MANNSQNTSNSQQIQNNNIGIPIQPQQGQPRDKTQQSTFESEKKQKKGTQHVYKRKPMEAERDKQKAELEKSGNELKSLLAQFGSKAKAADDLDNDAKKIRSNIEALMAKAQARVSKPIQITPPPPSPQSQPLQPQSQPQPQPQSQSQSQLQLQLPATEQQQGFFTSSTLNNLVSMILFPFNFILNLIRLIYSSINWTVLLFGVLIVELIILGLIWTIKRSQYTYLYVEPYEPVVHGTFGVDQTMSWGIVGSVVDAIRDFIAEVMNGGRGFGSPSYDGFVPI